MELIPSKGLRRSLPWKVWQNDYPYPQDVKALIPRTCEYVMSHGKRDFVDIIKLDLGVRKLSWITWVSPMGVFMRGRVRGQSQRDLKL